MIISIQLSQNINHTEKVRIYNLVKRTEEDLKRRISALNNFNLDIHYFPRPGNLYNGPHFKSDHTLSVDESELNLALHLFLNPTTDHICEVVTKELHSLKELYSQ